jgi:two-component system cell cycle sensor histidine kinase/response regulator CckA
MYKILVADDEKAIRDTLGMLLPDLGYEVAGLAQDGMAAVRMAGRLQPDVVLMDIVMPGKTDGIAAGGIIQAQMDIPVVFMSGYATPEYIARAADMAAYGYLIKPFREEELAAAIEIAITQHRTKGTANGGDRFFRVFRHAPLLMALIDFDSGRFIDANEKFVEVTGYTRWEVLSKTPAELGWMSGKDRGRLAAGIKARGRVENMELTITTRDKKQLCCLYSGELLTLEDRPVVLSIAQDITDRKTMEDRRRRSEFIINAAGEFITMINRDYVYEMVSDSYCRAMGKARRDLVGRTVAEVWGEARFQEAIRDKIDRCFAGSIVNDEDWLTLPDSGRRFFHIHYYPYHGPGGDVSHAVVVSHDITELKQAELDLRAAERSYRDLVEHAAEGIFRSTREGRPLMGNQAIADMFGYDSPAELLAAITDVGQLYVRHEDREALLGAIDRDGAVRGFEAEFYRKDGSRIWLSLNMRAVRDADGNLLYYEGINQDITARKQADEERLRIEEQLLQSQKLETIGRLAAGMAHDFNNLIAPIRGFAEIMMEECEADDPHVDDLKQIKLAAEMAGNLTRQLLAFGRKQILSLKPVDMRQVVRGVERLLRRTVREDIAIRIKVPRALKKVNADISQIEQIIVNLAVNAQDAMPGKGLLVIELKPILIDADVPGRDPQAVQGDYVLMSISDTGCGMDEETMAHIFEPFFTTKEKGRGTGLGLSTVYGIVKQHGGFINVYSEVGKGTTLNIYLPCIKGERDEEMAVRGEAEVLPGGSETILIVEDNDMVLRMTRRALERIGYQVIAATDPEQCLRMMARFGEPIHLMLIDVIMPGMNGKELYERLSVMRPGVDVIYMSGYSEDVISHHGVLDAEVNFIQKPFSTRDLARLVRHVLGKAKG